MQQHYAETDHIVSANQDVVHVPITAELNSGTKEDMDSISREGFAMAANIINKSTPITLSIMRNYRIMVENNESICSKELMKEAEERILELRRREVQLDWLRALIDEKPVLSRLVITKDFRILLPDYNNKEIKMSPLPKAVFLLFLKHPEGIVFKQLHDYYSELMDIYKQLTNRVLEIRIRKSIRDLTDPTKNSINEKCSRIREAFLKEFDDRFAHHYYVTGQYGEAKKIILPRELVEWEEQ